MTVPLISIIVPVYNVEKYIDKCISSILQQTYPRIELLLIDDGSPDKSGIICDMYAQKDNRVRVFHKPNAGVSAARNTGINNAKGEFITFVDSDDWLEPDCIRRSLNIINKNELDLLQFSSKRRHTISKNRRNTNIKCEPIYRSRPNIHCSRLLDIQNKHYQVYKLEI